MQKEDMSIVIVGHVDHGKSTIIGRLLADTNSLPLGKLEQVREKCRRNSKPFEYAFLLDALKDEQEQGITIDSARCFFKTEKRNYILIDAPGHIEFLKNMVTGASRAEAALLVIDANEGIKENSKRHGYLLSMLGIKQLCVLVNKMDLVDYDNSKYNSIVKEYSEFLSKINVIPSQFIPVSGFKGENILNRSENMPWYTGSTLLEALDGFVSEKSPKDKPFRMPVQGVYKFTKEGDDRRIVAGTIETGLLNVGDEVQFYPSGKKSKVKTIEDFNAEKRDSISAGYSTGFTLDEQIYVKRGDLAVISGQKEPKVTTKIRVNLFWLGKNPLEKNKEYYLKLGTSKVIIRLEEVLKVLDASSLSSKVAEKIERNEVAECILTLNKEIALDLSEEIANTGRFVIVDNYDIAGGGIVLEALDREEILFMRNSISEASITQNTISRNSIIESSKWEKSDISVEERAEKYKHKSALILITGEDNSIESLANELERDLFEKGNFVYFLKNNKLLFKVDEGIRKQQVQQLAQIANIMLDAGTIVIAVVANLSEEDFRIIEEIVNTNTIEIISVGDSNKRYSNYEIHLIDNNKLLNESFNILEKVLRYKGIIKNI